MLSHAHDIMIDRGVGAHAHGKYVVDGLNATNKRHLSIIITTVQLPNSAIENSEIIMHTSTKNEEISLAKPFKKIFQMHPVHMA